MSLNDTIAAIATPQGRGGVSIIRVSGPDALSVARHVASLVNPTPRHAYFATFKDGETPVDEGVVLYFKAPHSYTGEDVIELQGHGGLVVPQTVLATALKVEGVRQAEPGEFTRRAFLNGKMDLTAAEAVEDLISSGSARAARAALSSLDGAFKEHVTALEERLINVRVRIEACLDFPEEHEDFFDSGAALEELTAIRAHAAHGLESAHCGVLLNEGASIVLAGAPNAGKSSLLNALAGADKAIVTSIPGTTRDTLEVNLEIGGIPVTMTDTAGIRDNPSDEIERIGIERAIATLKKADLILLMVDGSKEAPDALATLKRIEELTGGQLHLIVVTSKSDLEPCASTASLLASGPFTRYPRLESSTKREGGLNALRERLKEALGVIPEQGVFSARVRHVKALEETLAAIDRAIEMLNYGDLVLTAREITIASDHLGEITGKVTSDDILGKIFSTFCIGK